MGEQKPVPMGLAEVQSRLSLSSGQVLRLVERGELTMVRAPFGMRFDSDDVDRLRNGRPANSSTSWADGGDHGPGPVLFF